jgi:poly-gamma-glutamate synthesis protein (capsule biosynthesis protein)
MVTLFLCGDVMTGRGVDQILPDPGDPTLREDFVRDARRYVELAQARNGEIPRPVDPAWPWGDALEVLRRLVPDVRIINLETSITRRGDFAPGKAVHYRMSPDNVACLRVAAPDVCTLANNHVLDFGRDGLVDTLDALAGIGVRTAGAGRTEHAASAPAIVPVQDGTRVIVVSCAMTSSGVPPSWAARGDRPGIDLVEPSERDAAAITDRIRAIRRPGDRTDIAVVSVHWGTNWGYDVPTEHREFAHQLVDGGADVVHGHSSHHPRPIEIYRDRLILYGCGDFVDDYEGIEGYEKYRDDLRPMYLASLAGGRLTSLRIVVLQARQLRLHRASFADAAWLHGTLDRISRPFGTHVALDDDGTLMLPPVPD